MVADRPRSSSGAPTVAWDLSKVLLVAAAAALLVAVWFAFRPVENPGVQACGGSLRYIVANTQDVVVPVGVAGAPPDAPRLRAQPPCSELVLTELTRAGLFASVGIALGLLGAVFGLLDDRVAYRRAPRFESLVRARPADAPQRVFDPEPTTVEDLAGWLPPVEPVVLTLLAVAALSSAVGAALLVGFDALVAAVVGLGLGHLALVAGLALAARVVAGVGRRYGLARSGSDDPVGATGAGAWVRVATAADWAGHVRPEVTVAGIDVHALTTRGLEPDDAASRARAFVTAALVVHVATLGALLVMGAPVVPEPDSRNYLLLFGAVAVLGLLGMARLPRRARAVPLLPGVDGVRAFVGAPTAAAVAVVTGGALVAVEVAAVWVAVQGAGSDLSLSAVALAWLLAVTVGMASPFPSGSLLTEATLALLLWRWGLTAPDAVAVALVVRVLGFWIPMVVGRSQTKVLDHETRGRAS